MLGPYSENTIVVGDCLAVMAAMPDGCVDLVVTDPPYFLPAQHYQTRKQFARSLADLSILEHFFRSVFDEFNRILSDAGALYVFCDGQSYPVFFVSAYPYMKYVRPLIWDKVVSFNGYSWRHQHELILFGVRPKEVPVKTGDGDILRCRAVPVGEREHPAEKPAGLVRTLIAKSSKEGSLVFDPFMGSGTTAVAADCLGRNFFGCDISPRYVKMALERIAGDRKKWAQLQLL